ncbi:MAG: polysaccharide deacetylase family protein [Firmicutes bacterium]|nr:polysaccharide deacetylase family protein [Bacillota bacterium]
MNKKIIITILILIAAVAVGIYILSVTPHIVLNGESEVEVTMKDGYSEPGAVAKFSFKDISSHIEIDSKVNDSKVGTYTVTYTVTYLGKTDSAVRTVNVVDKEPPEITLEGGDSISIRPGQKFSEPGYRAVDDSDGDVTSTVFRKGIVDVSNKGSYVLTYEATDSYGNHGAVTRKVKVEGEPVKQEKGTIYLTFDDGPSLSSTPEILDILKKYKIHGTFFIINYGDDKNKLAIVKRAIKEGNTVALHSYSHDYSRIYKSSDVFMDNLKQLHDKLKNDTGYEAFCMRFPGGSSNTISKNYCSGIMTELAGKVQEEGYLYNDWNVDSTDASGNNVPADRLIASVKKECSKNTFNVVLMHDTDAKATTVKALPEIIEWGLEEGYSFKAITKDSPTFHHRINN